MTDESAVLEQQDDADASPAEESTYVDKSIDTAPEALKVETEAVEDEVEAESEGDSSPPEVEVLDEKADTDDAEFSETVKTRIDELTGKWRETERLVDVKDAELAELRKQLADIPTAPAEPFKTLADFEYDEGRYQAYLADENSKRTAETVRQLLDESQAERQSNQLEVKFEERAKEFAKSVKDYDEVTRDRSLQINQPMARVIKSHDNGPEIAYYLGKNPDVARRIAQMPAELAGFELAKVDATLQTAKVKAAPKKVTKAPPPPPKIKSGDEGLQRGFREGMSDAEFAKMRRKQIAQR